MKKNQSLKKAWKEYLSLRDKSRKLYDKGYDLYHEANVINGDAWTILVRYLNDYYNTRVVFYDKYKLIMANGVILYYDGRVYEPLDVVMKRIVKEEKG